MLERKHQKTEAGAAKADDKAESQKAGHWSLILSAREGQDKNNDRDDQADSRKEAQSGVVGI